MDALLEGPIFRIACEGHEWEDRNDPCMWSGCGIDRRDNDGLAEFCWLSV